MKISLNWIKEYVDLPHDKTPQQWADDLTVATVEVEEVIDQAKMFNKMIIGEITDIQSHPNADKLKICITNIGEAHPAQIICGGLNIYVGMKVAVALSGALVKWHGEGELIELKKTTIRGVESQGMICSAVEIGLTDEHPVNEPYVMDLKTDAAPGTPLAEALGLNDIVLDIDNKSVTHRPDLWGHFGMAREFAAIYNTKLKELALGTLPEKENASIKVSIDDTSLCRRFMAIQVNNVRMGESPAWMQQRLTAAGMRPINNIVDISNYVMLETGQPNHMFDTGKLGDSVTIRNAKKGETLQTLDGIDRTLDPSILLVTKGDTPLAIAGIMGGGNSEVDEQTSSLVIEVANFDSITVRRASQKLGLRTEASTRFEKSLDPALTETAAKRIIYLISQIIPEAQVTSLTGEGVWHHDPITVETSVEFINKRIGIDISGEEMTRMLSQLGFTVTQTGSQLSVVVPSWRSTGDVSIQEDIVEEVARMYGYNNLSFTVPSFKVEHAILQKAVEVNKHVKYFLSMNAGMREVFNYPWTEEYIVKKLSAVGYKDQFVSVENPPADENRYLATSLIPNLLKNTENNLRFYDTFRLFECARVFVPDYTSEKDNEEKLPKQPKRLSGIYADKNSTREELFYKIKGIIENILTALQIEHTLSVSHNEPWLEPGYALTIEVNKAVIGSCGIINNKLASSLKIEASVAAFELEYEALVENAYRQVVFERIPEYPAVMRDIAIIVDQKTPYRELEAVISAQSDLLVRYELFDVYSGSQIGAGKRSLAWHLAFRHHERTLTSQEADEELSKIIKALETQFKAELRS